MRKTKDVTITLSNRDNGKVFRITEMASRPAEQWADRAFLALAHSALDLPPGIDQHAGMADVAGIARLMSGIKFPELGPLMDELLGCVKRIEDPHKVGQDGQPFVRALIDNGMEGDDIEDVQTRQFLRREVLELHVNFSLAAVLLNLIALASEMKTLPGSGTTSTPRRRLRR